MSYTRIEKTGGKNSNNEDLLQTYQEGFNGEVPTEIVTISQLEERVTKLQQALTDAQNDLSLAQEALE